VSSGGGRRGQAAFTSSTTGPTFSASDHLLVPWNPQSKASGLAAQHEPRCSMEFAPRQGFPGSQRGPLRSVACCPAASRSGLWTSGYRCTRPPGASGWDRPSRRGPWSDATATRLEVAALGPTRASPRDSSSDGRRGSSRAACRRRRTPADRHVARLAPCRSCGTDASALNSVTAFPTSVVTVPVFGLGHEAARAESPTSLATWAMRSGVADGPRPKSIIPPQVFVGGRNYPIDNSTHPKRDRLTPSPSPPGRGGMKSARP